jgi:beta-glucosidase
VRRVLSKLLVSRGYGSTGERPSLEWHARVAYEAAAKRLVPLRNDGALPIDRSRRVAFSGMGQVLAVKKDADRALFSLY